MNIHTIDELTNVKDKFVLVRDDFNVQIVDGLITDAFRIEQSLPTIKRLMDGGAKIVIMSHLGRPKGEKKPELSLKPIALVLEQLLGKKLLFVNDCLDHSFMSGMKNGDVALLENLRYYNEEEKNDKEFARKLSEGFDFYVNDAFAVSHRAHASVEAITKFLPSFAGLLLASEIKELNHIMSNPERPLVGIISGGKVSTKIGVIKSLAKLCDKVIIAGRIGTSFIIANGATNVKDIFYEDNMKKTILEIMKKYGSKIILPIAGGVSKTFDKDAPRIDKTISEITPDDIILDDAPESISEFKKVIDTAKTVVWNGTLGVAEWQPTWSKGTFELAKYIAAKTESGQIESIIGGGNTVAALEDTNTKDKMTYVSTGGGAFLEFLEGLPLPGIKALEK